MIIEKVPIKVDSKAALEIKAVDINLIRNAIRQKNVNKSRFNTQL